MPEDKDGQDPAEQGQQQPEPSDERGTQGGNVVDPTTRLPQRTPRQQETPSLSKIPVLALLVSFLALLVSAYAICQNIENTRRDQRAWVGPSAAPSVKGLDYAKGKGEYTVSIKNFGKTPALKFNAPFEIYDNESGIAAGQNAFCDTRMYDNDPLAEWGRTVWPGEFREKVKLPKLPEVPNIPKVTAVFVAGCITYNDIFGKRHWTKFCYVTYKPELSAPEFKSCDQHNETDDSLSVQSR